MKVRVPSQIWGMVAAILFLVAHPSQGIAAATSLEAYNPKEDPKIHRPPPNRVDLRAVLEK